MKQKIVAVLAGMATVGLGLISASSISAAQASYAGDHPFTAQEAVEIKAGKIVYDDGSPTGYLDSSLVNGPIMDPAGDDDFDGLTNSEELHVYTKGGVKYLHYLSHPKLEDTDGDGLPDKTDPHRLAWDLHAHDAVMFQELTYRDDPYILKVLGQDAIDSKQTPDQAAAATLVPLPQSEWYKGRQHYQMMRRELAPYWKLKKTWHTGSGFDASLFEFSNRTFPFLENGSTHMLAIRGTAGAKDVAADTALAFGQWFGQVTDVVSVADELAKNPAANRNLYVCGHSLGGYLTQIFMAHSVGGKWGQPENNPSHDNWNYWNKHLYNPEVKQAFGFNGVRIAFNLFNKALQEYYLLSRYVDTVYKNKYFQVNNDHVISAVGYPDAKIMIGDSAGGHSSTSFFEPKFKDVEGFSVGKRNDLSGVGYQDPNLTKVQFLKPTVLEVLSDGQVVKSVTLAKTQKELDQITLADIASDIDPSIQLDEEPHLKYGLRNQLNGHLKQIKVTYKFQADGQSVGKPVVITTPYQTDYQAPEIPASQDPDYRYQLQTKPMPKVAVQDLVKDQELTVNLVREPIIVTTTVKFENDGKVVKTITKETKPSQKPHLEASDYPEGAVIPSELPTLKAGETNTINYEAKTFPITFRYVDVTNNDQLVGSEDQETVAYGADSHYQLQIPDGYELAPNYTFQAPTAVTAAQTVTIKLQPQAPDTWQITFHFMHKGKVVGQQVNTVSAGQTVQLIAPTYPNPDREQKYLLSSENQHYTVSAQTETADQVVEIPVQLSQKAVELVAPIHYYQIVVHYQHAGKTVKTEQQKLKEGTPIQFTLPTSEAGTYNVAPGTTLPDTATKDLEINVPLQFTANQYPVTVRYVYTDPNTQTKNLIAEEQTTVTHGEKPVIKQKLTDETPGRYYQPSAGWEAPAITKETIVVVPLEQVIVKYRVKVKYIDSEANPTEIATQDLTVPAGEVTNLVLPTAHGFDGQYVLNEDFNNPIINQDQTLTVPLKRQLNVYKVTLKYSFNGQVVLSSAQSVESGKTAHSDYDQLVAQADQEQKSQLEKYRVPASFDWSKAITQNTELTIPLELKEQPTPQPTPQPQPQPQPNPEPEPTPQPNPEPEPTPQPQPQPEPQPQPNKPVPNLAIVQGNNQSWSADSNKPALFVSNGTYDLRTLQVLIDDRVLNPELYQAVAGSIHVSISPTYLRTLSLGRHKLGIRSAEGLAETYFTIQAPTVSKTPTVSTTGATPKPGTPPAQSSPHPPTVTAITPVMQYYLPGQSILAATGTTSANLIGWAVVSVMAGTVTVLIRRESRLEI